MSAGSSSGCYFVGKQTLLKWLSEFLRENVTKIEDCASGHHYILLLDCVFPNQINFAKAKMNAQLEWERMENLKIVQDTLARNQVDRVVDVEKLSKGKMQDNLEFLQWFKWWFDSVYERSEWDVLQARARFGKKSVVSQLPQRSSGQFKASPGSSAVQEHVKQKEDSPIKEVVQKQQPVAKSYAQQVEKLPLVKKPMTSHTTANEVAVQQLETLQQEADQLRKLGEKRTKESKFYFGKLRQVEILMGEVRDGKPNDVVLQLVQRVEDILYAPYKE